MLGRTRQFLMYTHCTRHVWISLCTTYMYMRATITTLSNLFVCSNMVCADFEPVTLNVEICSLTKSLVLSSERIVRNAASAVCICVCAPEILTCAMLSVRAIACNTITNNVSTCAELL